MLFRSVLVEQEILRLLDACAGNKLREVDARHFFEQLAAFINKLLTPLLMSLDSELLKLFSKDAARPWGD